MTTVAEERRTATYAEREVTFTEADVEEWCEESGDSNPLHLDADAAEDGPFEERVVPGMMVLDQVSGLITDYGEDKGGDVILSSIVAARFRDPIPIGKTVIISVEEVDEDGKFTYLDFEADTEELAVHGTVSVVID